jgi:uncharacterized lipoprotein YmbA
MRPVCRRLAMMTLVASLLGLGACASMPSRFYLLTPLNASETSPATTATQGPVIGIGPVTLPKYLDRPQIVTRASRNQLTLGEFDRWAEPLQDNVSRVLGENLARLVPTDHILLQTWPRPATLDYQVTVEVWQFDGGLGGESTLLARWSILDGAERELFNRMAHLHAPSGGQGYEAMVVVMNQMIDTLSRDIATAIQNLASRVVTRE